MATITAKIRKDQKDKNGLCRIIILYRNGNETPAKFSIGQKVLPQQFNEASGEVINHKDAIEINIRIGDEKQLLRKIVSNLTSNDIEPSPKKIKTEYQKFKDLEEQNNNELAENLNLHISVIDAWEELINLKTGIVNITVIGDYRTAQKHVLNYCEINNLTVSWKLFDDDFYEKWTSYFINECVNSHGEIGLKNSTMGKHFKNLKVFLGWAFEKNYINNLKFKKYKVIREITDVFPLSEFHLAKMVAFADNQKNPIGLRKIASLFVFLSTTGLRYSDSQHITWSDIQYTGADNISEQFLRITTKKTNQKLYIPFNEYSLRELRRNSFEFDNTELTISSILKPSNELLNKDNTKSFFTDKEELNKPLLPQITPQHFNRGLKEVGELCNFTEPIKITYKSGSKTFTKEYRRWEKLSSHDCRRTFITLSLQKGMRPETVMAITGHTTMKTMMRYNKIAKNQLLNEFQDVWGKTRTCYDEISGFHNITQLKYNVPLAPEVKTADESDVYDDAYLESLIFGE